ncbi:CubicO group peptidase (beta-lactamase class C family) [Mucilaginibacter yixingensis]|uniref:CubicO group peptidase (Beta-lactamase class C family) n=1 Tax=Mucilaginibacter yixingensis TaxID=1295612 RepID=A0A2T5JGR0_9SPHI|nr:serine hydrolase domain-containing protein [Mucilaginibacter yixingensis]PTR01617.1 CubicO group peptidase (beta-lactamase class C family) [Mucilaginibacter yixingensis]
MKKHIITILALTFSIAAQAQNFQPVDRWLDDNAAKMGGRVMLMVYKDGQIVYSRSANNMTMAQKMAGRMMARRMGQTPSFDDYTASTRQPMASCSKWFSAALVMTFIDEGKLKLTDTVGKYLPMLSQHGKGRITIGQCLSHLTGIKAPELRESMADMRNARSMDDAINQIAQQPIEGAPGTVFHYSNDGLQIAGAVIEKISGKSFETLFTERIAHPLEMKDTDFGKGPVALPAGGAGSTPNDYMNFLEMILNKGTFKGKRILSEKSIAEMQINRLSPSVKIGYSPVEAGNFGYGYGEWVMEGGAVTSPGLFGSFPLVDNQRHYAGFLMCVYIKNDGRNERYKQLKSLLDTAMK